MFFTELPMDVSGNVVLSFLNCIICQPKSCSQKQKMLYCFECFLYKDDSKVIPSYCKYFSMSLLVKLGLVLQYWSIPSVTISISPFFSQRYKCSQRLSSQSSHVLTKWPWRGLLLYFSNLSFSFLWWYSRYYHYFTYSHILSFSHIHISWVT
jgi:hypothetical protein